MKIADFKNSMQKMDEKQLLETLDKLRRELFSLRLSSATAHVKNYALFKQYRKNIARVLTLVGQRSNVADSE